MTAAGALIGDDDLVAAYATWDGRVPARVNHAREARRFLREFGSLVSWAALPLDARLAAPVWARTFVAWAALSGRLAVDADYVVGCNSMWATLATRLHPDEADRFVAAATALGFPAREARHQWSVLTKIAVLAAAASPLRIDADSFARGRGQLLAVARTRRWPETITTPAYGLAATLFHLGVTDARPERKPRTGHASRQRRWQRLEHAVPVLAATMRRYLDQIALSLRPGSCDVVDTSLRTFATWLLDHHPDITRVRDLRRAHVEDYKAWLPTQRGYRAAHLSTATIASRIGDLRAFIDRIIEWGWDDAPARPLLFAGDLPIADQPLPRFLDDAAAAALRAAARDHPDPLVRLVVEMLARTGLRKGELLALTVDAVVAIGGHHWLRVPVGKLHTDRYIPLHPHLKTLLAGWLADRPALLRSDLLLVERGRPLPSSRIDRAVADCAAAAGLGHVTPHQLRHTLATQAVNRGMSLEAIAALLGHRSMTMTMTYARIADHTVADEYFAVTEQVEALYQQPAPAALPADAEGAHMSRLRGEVHHRLLGNGWCTRPAQLDCRYESICETCTFFATTPEHLPVLQRQRDDAAAKHQTDRAALFDRLLNRLDDQAS
jgi:integrase